MSDLTPEKLAELRRLLHSGPRDCAIGMLFVDNAEERDEIAGRLAHLLCDLTGGRMSKTSYPVPVMAQEIEQYLSECHESDLKDERDALAAKLDAVRALHQPEVNSTSALFPTPLCGCGDAHPCATIRALDATPQTGGES